MWSLVRYISLRRIVSSPVRSLLTLLGVALGVAMLAGMAASNDSIVDAFGNMAVRATGNVDLVVVGDEAGIDQNLVEVLEARSDLIAHAAGRIEQTSFLEADGGKPGERVLVLGVDFLGDRAFLPFATAQGNDVFADPIAFLNDPEAILVTDTLAKRRGLAPGSALRLRTAARMADFHVASVLSETGKTRAFGGQVVVLFLDAAQLAFNRRGKVDRIDLALKPGVDVADAQRALAKLIGARGRVERPSERARELSQMTASFRVGLHVQAMMAMLVGMFLIYNAIAIAVVERKREIGMLRSFGVSRARISAIFLAEAALVGLFGGALGVVLGGALARVIVNHLGPTVSELYENIIAPVPHVTAREAAMGVASGLLAALIAAWVPARRAAKASPVETLRRDLHAAARTRLPVVPLAVGGALLLPIAALFAKFGGLLAGGFGAFVLVFAASVCVTPFFVARAAVPMARVAEWVLGVGARLGVDNVARELGRSALTVCALVLATAMSMTSAIYSFSYESSLMNWADHAMHADITMTAGSPVGDKNAVPFSADTAAYLRDLPGLAGIDELNSVRIAFRGMTVNVLSDDTDIYLRHPITETLAGPASIHAGALTREPSVLVSENFARRTGLTANDTFDLPTPTGLHKVKIVAVVVDYSSEHGWLMIDRKYLREYWHDARITALELYLAPGTDITKSVASVRERLAKAGALDGMFILTNAALKDEVQRIVRQALGYSHANEIVALAIAILGIVGTMVAAVIDRVREIGVLRAVGTTRRQIVLSVMAEAGFLGLCAAVLGILVSIPAAFLIVKTVGLYVTGWSIPVRLPLFAGLRTFATVLVFSILSGALPGLKAARLSIPQALAYE